MPEFNKSGLRVMPTKVEEKKGMATEKQDKDNVKLRKRKEVFVYGNYRKYYGYRLGHNMEEDPRLKVFKREWFENKDCLDIGCNQGLVTITIAKKFLCRSIVGIDIDKGLIEDAKCNLRNTVRKKRSQDILAKGSIPEGLNCGDLSDHKVPQISNEEILYTQCYPPLPREHDLFQRVSFHCENFVENMCVCSEKFDTILCLSVTKWIHLNWGDDGLLTLFSKIWRLLKPGGVLLLEPQPWTSYKRYRLLSELCCKRWFDLSTSRLILLPGQAFPCIQMKRTADTARLQGQTLVIFIYIQINFEISF